MAVIPNHLLTRGVITLHELGSLLQPHHVDILYVHEGAMHVVPNIEVLLTKFKDIKLRKNYMHYSGLFTTHWTVMEDCDCRDCDCKMLREWTFFHADVVKDLLA